MPVIHFDAQRQHRDARQAPAAAAIAARQAQGARELIAFAKAGQIGGDLWAERHEIGKYQIKELPRLCEFLPK